MRRALEVGVFTGYSGLCVAQALPEDGVLVACDVSADWTAVACRSWAEAGVAGKIDLRLAPALETLDALLAAGQAETFGFAFIDADKPNYDGYYERVLRLLCPRGVMVVDNVLWGGQVAETGGDADTRALRALNEKIAADPRVRATTLTVADGLTLASKRA